MVAAREGTEPGLQAPPLTEETKRAVVEKEEVLLLLIIGFSLSVITQPGDGGIGAGRSEPGFHLPVKRWKNNNCQQRIRSSGLKPLILPAFVRGVEQGVTTADWSGGPHPEATGDLTRVGGTGAWRWAPGSRD
jgi:hypothetical protein